MIFALRREKWILNEMQRDSCKEGQEDCATLGKEYRAYSVLPTVEVDSHIFS